MGLQAPHGDSNPATYRQALRRLGAPSYAQLHREGSAMFIIEGRTLGVFAALGVVFSMAVVLDRPSDSADSTEPRSLSSFTNDDRHGVLNDLQRRTQGPAAYRKACQGTLPPLMSTCHWPGLSRDHRSCALGRITARPPSSSVCGADVGARHATRVV